MLEKIPTDKNGKPLKFCQIVAVDSGLFEPSIWGRVMNPGVEKSIIALEGGEINVFDNSKIEIKID